MVPRGLVCPARKVTASFNLPFMTAGPLSSWLPRGQSTDRNGAEQRSVLPQDLPGAWLCSSGSVHLNNDPGCRMFHRTDVPEVLGMIYIIS